MFLEVLLAIVVIIVICMIFYILVVQPRRSRARAKRLLEISNGTFDDAARDALQDLDAQTELTPEQHAMRGNIIRYNMLENPRHVPRGPAERRQFGRMVRDYENAIRGVGRRLQLRDHVGGGEIINGAAGGWNGIGGGWNGGAGNGWNGNRDDDAVILHNAMTLNDLFGPAVADPIEQDFDILQMMIMLNGAINEAAPVVQHNTIERRVTEATLGAENRAEVVENALRPRFTEDTQNVHDTKISGDSNEILRKISAPVDVEIEIAGAERYITDEADLKPIARERALGALRKMAERGPMSTYGLDEGHILALVWKRCSHVRNIVRRDEMQQSVASALADCYDGTPPKLVCANGRCTRVINSLALIDYDPSITSVMTFEAYKNEVMREVGEIFDNALEAAAEGTPEQRTVAESYRNPAATADPEAERAFKNDLRDAVDNLLAGYGDKFNARELEQLRQECYVYVTL